MTPMPKRNFPLFIATAALLCATLLVGHLAARRVPDPLASPLAQINSSLSGWLAIQDERLDASTLHALDATAVLSRVYRKRGQELQVFIAYYAQQRAGESMHSPKHCLPGAGWEIWRHESALIPVDGKQTEINVYSIQQSGVRRLVLYWYQSKDRIVADEYLGKLLLAWDTISTGHTGGSIVRIIVPDQPEQLAEARVFASALIPQIERCIGSRVIRVR